MTNILIIEDEPKVASFIQRGLTAEGFHSDVAHTGNQGVEMAAQTHYDVITVDLMLPERDGYSVIEALKSRKLDSGILILSARDTLEDKLKGFNLGSDDYLAKPFAFEELVARIQALLRRRKPQSAEVHIIEYSTLELDPNTRSVRRGQRKIELTNMEFKLLEYLMQNASKVCTRSQIALDVWQESFDRETNIVDVYMMYLRKKIDVPGDSPLIQTIRGVGYMLSDEIK